MSVCAWLWRTGCARGRRRALLTCSASFGSIVRGRQLREAHTYRTSRGRKLPHRVIRVSYSSEPWVRQGHDAVTENSSPTDRAASHGQPAAGPAYRDRLTALAITERQLQRRHIQLGYLRLMFGIAAVVLLLPPRFYVLLAVGAFGLAARAHEVVLRRLAETRRAIAFYDHALARVEDRWAGLRPRQTRLDFAESLFAADLDLFGPGSLFELLCGARTSLGEDTLAAWLLRPAPVPEALRRQSAVEDLRSRSHLREAAARASGPATAALDLETLSAWGEASRRELPRMMTWLAPLLVALSALACWRSAVTHSLLPIAAVLLLNGCLTFFWENSYRPVFASIHGVSRSLHTVETLLRASENEPFTAPSLLQWQSRLSHAGSKASDALARLATLSTWIDARGNYLVRLLDVPLLYSLQLAMAAERWHSAYGSQLRIWLQTLGEFEALLSLSGYSFEHPEDPFPEFSAEAPAFLATGLGHPLLSGAIGVRNDVALDTQTRLLLVSGSNMSGKSTLLRSVGINTVLAFAGAPVRAHSLRLSALTLAASIQVNDSLRAGQSRFYAEILRLRAIAGAAHTHPPVLFLLDELLSGTNSTDRLTGAEGIVRDLLQSGAIGLLSTHDLALTSLAGQQAGPMRNVHFEDRIVDGALHFDYKLREGVVQRSNGIALMRLMGLDV